MAKNSCKLVSTITSEPLTCVNTGAPQVLMFFIFTGKQLPCLRTVLVTSWAEKRCLCIGETVLGMCENRQLPFGLQHVATGHCCSLAVGAVTQTSQTLPCHMNHSRFLATSWPLTPCTTAVSASGASLAPVSSYVRYSPLWRDT